MGWLCKALIYPLMAMLSCSSAMAESEKIAVVPPVMTTNEPVNHLTANAAQMARLLKVDGVIDDLKSRVEKTTDQSNDNLIQILLLRQKLSRSVQYASLELEEALANIDGDIASTSMELAFFTDKHDRSALLNGMATFIASGTLGVLDSSSGIKHGAPLPNIFGITGNSIAIGLPLLGLYPPKYKNPEAGSRHGNMLAPIFGRPYSGAGYDPLIWSYLEEVPAAAPGGPTRREHLLKNWQTYRGLARGNQSKPFIDLVAGVSAKDSRIGLDLLKTRSELLVDLRAIIQQMYKDISDLNSYIMTL